MPILLIAIACAALMPSPQTANGRLTFNAPPEWTTRPASSSMRVAEFVLPKTGKDAEDAELVVYFFGGTGGSIEANIDRWLGQMQQPGSGSSKDAAVRETRDVGGLKVTLLNVPGTYVAEVRPGATERHNKPGFRMRTAVIETPRGPYFLKLVGPEATVTKWAASFDAFVGSLRFEP